MATAVPAAQQHIGQGAAQELLRLDLRGFFVGVVPHAGFGHVAQFVAAVAQAVRQLNVFAVQKQQELVTVHRFDGLGAEQHAGAGAPRCFARDGVIVFGVLVGLLAALPSGDWCLAGGLALGDILLRSGKEGGEGVGFKLQVDIGDPKEGRVGKRQVEVVACAKANVGALVERHGCKFLGQRSLLL